MNGGGLWAYQEPNSLPDVSFGLQVAIAFLRREREHAQRLTCAARCDASISPERGRSDLEPSKRTPVADLRAGMKTMKKAADHRFFIIRTSKSVCMRRRGGCARVSVTSMRGPVWLGSSGCMPSRVGCQATGNAVAPGLLTSGLLQCFGPDVEVYGANGY